MDVVYIVSVEEAAGKTAVCAGLGRFMQSNGKKVGYLKPLAVEKGDGDGDIAFMKHVLGLPGEADMSDGRDVVLVEGMVGAGADDAVSRTIYGAAREMSARVMAVEAYTGGASKYVASYQGFGKNLLGVVLNKVPVSQLKRVQDEASKQFGAAGVNVLGVLPEDRALFTVTVGELADGVQGKILNNADKAGELVESFMLGAMVVDSGLNYFGRRNGKAAIIRHDRPDMQMAALETSTRCLVLSGSSQPPIYSVAQKAESRGIPVIAAETATSDIIASIEDALSRSRFHQEKKLQKLAEIMEQHLNLQAAL